MKEEAVVAIMCPVSIDWGRVSIGGGTGHGFLYFQVSADKQLIIAISGYSDGFRAKSAGRLEPKQEWKRVGSPEDHSIWVPDAFKFLSVEQMEAVIRASESK